MDALIDQLANRLIATGAWLDADPFYAAGAHPAVRVVQHASDANLYVWFARQVTSAPLQPALKWNEIVCLIASGYNTGSHAVSGTTQTTGIPCEFWQTGNVSYPYYWNTTTGSGNKTGQYFLWVDANGVSLLATWTSATGYDYSNFLALERNTTKEYADGFTNLFVTAFANNDPENTYYTGTTYQGRYYGSRAQSGNPTSTDLNRASYARPFSLTDTVYTNGIATFFDCYKSAGNAKVYFQFPYYSNNLDPLRRTPIAQTQRWFRIGIGLGIADGDLIDWVNGAETWKYLAKTLQSPDSALYLPIAIRYA